MKGLADHVVYHDRRLAERYAKTRIPMATLYEAYIDGAIDIPGDIYELLRDRKLLVKFTLTLGHLKWAITNLAPEVTIHSKAQDARIVREHYDRGDDFFGWFLGERMIYTSAFFMHPGETLEQAQDNKIKLACQKLQLGAGDRLLDIGCGWGTFACHAAALHAGVESTGVTLAKKQAAFAERQAQAMGVAARARFLCADYRDIPAQRYSKIASFEMVEHVGIKNLRAFYDQVRDLLEDDGLFLLQWTGFRRGLRPEDLIFSLFMNRFIFPGADASLCPSSMIAAMERAGWETHSVENISHHYGWTIKRWHDNWLGNRARVVAAYGERWFRLWHFFLAWATFIGAQGTAACFQVVLNKNINGFDRTRWTGARHVMGDRMSAIAPVAPLPRSVAAPAVG